jgi:hypothetical protein
MRLPSTTVAEYKARVGARQMAVRRAIAWSMNLYQELKSWQTVIGSLLGFLALMIGAMWNFHLNRRRDAVLRTQESLSVAAALYGEILLLRKEAASLARTIGTVHENVGMQRDPVIKFDAHFVAANTLPEPMLYQALASKLGMLDADLVVAITKFHSDFAQARSGIPLLQKVEGRGYSHSVLTVLIPCRDAVSDIVPALRKMERILAITVPADDPDLGLTETFIEMEEKSFEQ